MSKTLRNDPDRRMASVVATADVSGFPVADLQRLDRDLVPGWIEALKAAEASSRVLRYRLEALLTAQERTCWACGGPVVGRADRVYCSAACRQRAHRGTGSRFQS